MFPCKEFLPSVTPNQPGRWKRTPWNRAYGCDGDELIKIMLVCMKSVNSVRLEEDFVCG
jgi:hypothetical protein